MKSHERQTRSYLMKLFRTKGFHPQTHLGQNFLIDLNIVEYIVDRAQICPDDVVLEVGAGTGGMSTYLAEQAAALVTVEVDQNMHRLAEEALRGYDNVTLLKCDALANKNNLSNEVLDVVQSKLDEAPERRLLLVSNLPYNIATPIISNLVATELPWIRMVVTIQLELGERMVAKPSTSDYSALSVWLQSQCGVRILKTLGPTVFWPRPKVNSAIMHLVPNKQKRETIRDRKFFHEFVRRLFHQRRKLLRSMMVSMYRKQLTKAEMDAILESLGLKANARAEELAPHVLVKLASSVQAAIEVSEVVDGDGRG
jgi:16S rRNA (adenine1518-N6/adenine1519-N6)-dimethyltransferase